MKSVIYREHYIVYEDGRVWSNKSHKWLKPNINPKTGYVNMLRGEYLHRTIAKLFIPNPENKRTVNHKDGNKLNNCVSNLEWSTHSENHKHAYRVLGRTHNDNQTFQNQKGQGNYQSKLIDSQVIEIRNSKLSGVELSKKFGVSRALISQIRNYKMWNHL